MGKTNPLNDQDMEEFIAFAKTKKDSEQSWVFNVNDLDEETFDLSPKNPKYT
jgi:type I restriction enzyme M protein